MSVKYYILGSKYKLDGSWHDKFPEMLKKRVLSVGWADEVNLTRFYGKPEEDIVKFLKTKKQSPRSCPALKKFLTIKPGDLIAVKEFNSPLRNQLRLVIRAYAVVVERNGQVYKWDPKGLGHLINVKFLKHSLSREFALNYAQTIHRLTNKDHIKQIFGSYSRALETVQRKKSPSLKGTTKKNTAKQRRSGSAAYVAEAVHNRLQKRVYDFLCKKYGTGNVKMEERGVDIILRKHKVTTLFEMKPYGTAKRCIREALGQLIEYSWDYSTGDNLVSLAVVGRVKPNAHERKLINYVKKNLRLQVKYYYYTKGRLVDS